MEDFKSFKLHLHHYNENGDLVKDKPTTVKVNNLINTSGVSVFNNTPEYSLSFSITLPDYVHKFLLDKTVQIGSSERSYKKDHFKKTINSEDISSLSKTFNRIMSDYRDLKMVDKLPLEKVIFYDLTTDIGNFQSSWNGAHLGNKQEIKFKLSIGYVVKSENNKTSRYNENKMLITTSYNQDFYKMKYVPHTEEREVFFQNLKNSMEGIIDQITNFEKNITEENIDNIINQKQKLLG